MFSFHYIRNQILHLLLVLIGVSLITFALSHVIPGDPARMMVGDKASEETLAHARVELGLDKPLTEQYVKYVTGLMHGDMGISIRSQQPVSQELKKFFPATLELTLAAMILAIIFGIVLGIVAAVYRNRWPDHLCRVISLVGVSTPLFWSGVVALIIFYKWIPIFPASGRLDTFISPPTQITGMYVLDGLLTGNLQVVGNAIHHLILPSVCLAYVQLAIIARQVRSSMIDVLEEDYIRTARSCGIPTKRILYHYALKNALLPTVTIAGLTLADLLSGAIITETIFGWPGMGKYVVDAITFLDFPAIMGFTMIVSCVYVFINFVVDIVYRFLDPQIREVDK